MSESLGTFAAPGQLLSFPYNVQLSLAEMGEHLGCSCAGTGHVRPASFCNPFSFAKLPVPLVRLLRPQRGTPFRLLQLFLVPQLKYPLFLRPLGLSSGWA